MTREDLYSSFEPEVKEKLKDNPLKFFLKKLAQNREPESGKARDLRKSKEAEKRRKGAEGAENNTSDNSPSADDLQSYASDTEDGSTRTPSVSASTDESASYDGVASDLDIEPSDDDLESMESPAEPSEDLFLQTESTSEHSKYDANQLGHESDLESMTESDAIVGKLSQVTGSTVPQKRPLSDHSSEAKSLLSKSTDTPPLVLDSPEVTVQDMQNLFVYTILEHMYEQDYRLSWVRGRTMWIEYSA